MTDPHQSGPLPQPSRSWVSWALEPAIVRSSLRVAVVVGTLLVLINYGDRLGAGGLGPVEWVKILLTYCVPYGVSTYAAVRSVRQGV